MAPLCPALPGGETPQESSPTPPPRPSRGWKVSVVAQPWLQGALCGEMQEPRPVGQGPEATHKRPTGRGSSAQRPGRGAGGAVPILNPDPRPASKPKTPPLPGLCRAGTYSSNPRFPTAPPSGPSLPGARRGRLRSEAPAPRPASPGPGALTMRQPQGALQVAFRGALD